MQGLDHYDVSCDFEVVTIEGTGLRTILLARQEIQNSPATTTGTRSVTCGCS